jgi:Ion channel
MTRPHLLGQQLREYSIITWCFERLFWMLHQLSPSRLVRRSRLAHVSSQAFINDPHGSAVRRSRRVEVYLIAWFTIELLLIGAAAIDLSWPLWIPRLLVIVRILDIFQVSVNMSVFDQLRTHEQIVISSAVRTLVLSFVNYIELAVCFGLLYGTLDNSLIGATSYLDDLYFSAVTQLTIGYGDVRPVGWARLVSVIQGAISVAFTVLMLGRIVGVLPRIATVMRHSRDE